MPALVGCNKTRFTESGRNANAQADLLLGEDVDRKYLQGGFLAGLGLRLGEKKLELPAGS